jgi:hypothetical protein
VVSLGTPVSSTIKTDCHDITEILLKVALNTNSSPLCIIKCCNLKKSDIFKQNMIKHIRNRAEILVGKNFDESQPKVMRPTSAFLILLYKSDESRTRLDEYQVLLPYEFKIMIAKFTLIGETVNA